MSSNAKKSWLWFRRIFFVWGGGAFCFLTTWIFAFEIYGVPATTIGVREVSAIAQPAVLAGCVAGALFAFYLEIRKHGR